MAFNLTVEKNQQPSLDDEASSIDAVASTPSVQWNQVFF